jgi:hypothetical protein
VRIFFQISLFISNVSYRKLFTRNNNYELTNSLHQSNSSSRNDLNAYYNNTHYQRHQQIPNGHRTRSETSVHYESQPGMHLSPRYESRLASGSGAPISTNPLWTGAASAMVSSQPNLLAPQGPIVQKPIHRRLSPPTERRMTAVPLQHPLYSSHPNNKPSIPTKQNENQQKRPGPAPPPPPSQSNKKQTTQLKYLDTNEFILRASDGQLLKNSQYSNRLAPPVASRNYKPHPIHVNGNSSTMLDVYY